MKKTLILISIFMIMLISCSGKNKMADKALGKQTMGLPNPIHESSAEEITKELNVKFAVPYGAKNICYSIIAGNLEQMYFIWNEAECTARINQMPNQKIYPVFTITGRMKLHVLLGRMQESQNGR